MSKKDVSPLGLKQHLAKRALRGRGWVDIRFANTVIAGQIVSANDGEGETERRSAWTLDSLVAHALTGAPVEVAGGVGA